MKLYLQEDEYYPLVCIGDRKDAVEVDIPDEEVLEWSKAKLQFEYWNHKMRRHLDRTVRHIEEKSFAEKEYSDMTIADLRKEQDKPIDKEPKS